MKYIVLVGDGMADFPIKEFGGKTILQKANTPNMDYISKHGKCGLAQTVPDGLSPGSDVANMSIMGYDPKIYYTGRSPLEAASMNIQLESEDVAFRCNLVTIENENLKDYCAGHISSKESQKLIKDIDLELGSNDFKFYSGISYKHLLIAKNNTGATVKCTPPHDIMDEPIKDYLPKGIDDVVLNSLMDESRKILENHPINKKRIESGKNPANSIWLWGQGYAPKMSNFKDLYGICGSVISSVDLFKGIGLNAGLKVIEVPEVKGYLTNNYIGKAEYGIASLKENDIIFIHVETPDDAGHDGDAYAKMKTIEDFDEMTVGTVLEFVLNSDEDYSILVMPDHPTPIEIRTHTNEPVPFAIYSTKYKTPDKVGAFNEVSMKNGSFGTIRAYNLIKMLLSIDE
ncbi:MAG: cofactor-independent phosphoglycerate mutase [Methanosarcinaceae archaeon]|nr:cofactor-independent phosphoglycerate mutase [Methanosarcinaceae archaeon]